MELPNCAQNFHFIYNLNIIFFYLKPSYNHRRQELNEKWQGTLPIDQGNSMSTHTLFRIASGICQITILYHQWVNNKQNRPIKSSECPILKKLWSKWRFSPFWLSNTVFFTNRPFFNQIEQFKKEKLS